ncbi:hypothetical protein C8R46DRAFT_506699 [Mycena filopes]|nr:hypothetical protein C8R46DRAFT_506699 [Mycena filopes]
MSASTPSPRGSISSLRASSPSLRASGPSSTASSSSGRIFRPFKVSSSSRKSEWLGLSILTAKTATAASELAPFPYIKVACGLVVALLEAVEKLTKNQENLKDLCENIDEIVGILTEQVSRHGDTAAVKLKGYCEEFEGILRSMLQTVEKMHKHHPFKRFIHSASISAEIAAYERRIKELLARMTLIAGLEGAFDAAVMRPMVQEMHAIISRNIPEVQPPETTNNCPPASRIFHGRQKILAQMQEYFTQNSNRQHIYVLYGLGGAGKTQIALKFIQSSSHFTSIFLVDASTAETINAGLKNIVAVQNAGNSVEDAARWLVTKQENWLLLFDNADDPSLNLNKFIPPCNHGNILITSRNPELRTYGMASNISDMEEDDAITLLLKSVAIELTSRNQATAADIVKTLSYLPLAIVQAGAFIARSGDLHGFLALYSENRTRLLMERPAQTHSDYAWTVYTTWQMSFNRLSPTAATFLRLCSFLHRDGISERIFSRAVGYSFPSHGPSREELQQPLDFLSKFQRSNGTWDNFAFLDITNEILSYSLATFDSTRRTFSFHPLVHQWSRDILDDQESKYHLASSILGMSIFQIPEVDLQLTSLELILHIDAIMLSGQPSTAPDFRIQNALIYSWAGRHQEAKTLKLAVLEKQQLLQDDEGLDTLSAMHTLAATYIELGEFHKAKALQVAVVEKRSRILGDSNPETLSAMQNLSITLWSLGQFQKAEELERTVLEKRTAVLGEDHPDTLKAMYNLAGSYSSLGQFDKAEALGLQMVEKGNTILGKSHPDVLRAMFNLAIVYRAQGALHKTEELELIVLERRKATLGDGHPETLASMANLAVTYKGLGNFHKAVELETIVMERRRLALGDGHPATLTAMYNLGITYGELGQHEKAQALELVVMEKRRVIFGPDHPETLSAMTNLAVTYKSLKDFPKAQELQAIILEKRTSALSSDHPTTLTAMRDLARTYSELGQHEEAEVLEVEVMEKRRIVLGSDHADTLSAMVNLAVTYERLGRLEEAENLQLVALDKQITVLGEDHPSTLRSAQNLGVFRRLRAAEPPY